MVSRACLKAYISFQSIRIILLLKTSENSVCVFAILSISVLHYSTFNVQTNCFKNILQKVGKILHSFAILFLMLVIWQFNTFCIPVFLSLIFAMDITLIFILFIELIFNTYVKITCIIGNFIIFLILIFIIFWRIIFIIFYFLMFSCFLL